MTLGDLTAAQLGPSALLGLVVLLIITDRLVTRRRLLDERAEKEYWRKAAEVSSNQVMKLLGRETLSLATLKSLGVEAAVMESEGEQHDESV